MYLVYLYSTRPEHANLKGNSTRALSYVQIIPKCQNRLNNHKYSCISLLNKDNKESAIGSESACAVYFKSLSLFIQS